MSVVYGLKLACETYFYLAVVALLGMMNAASRGLLAVPALIGLGAGIGFQLSGRGERARYGFLALGLIPAVFGFRKAELLLALPMLVYSAFYVRNNRRATDYYYAFRRFRAEMVATPLFLLFSLTIGRNSLENAIPALFLYLAMSITLLRMLRHEERILRQRRFQMLNLAGIAGVGALGAALSTNWAIEALRAAARFLYTCALLPVLNAALAVIQLIVRGIGWFFSLFPHSDMPAEIPALEEQMGFGADGALEYLTAEEAMANPAVRRALEIVGIAIAVVAAFFVLRALSKHAPGAVGPERSEERESLDSPQIRAKRSVRARGEGKSVAGVRRVYASFLKMAEARGVLLNGRQNSLQIRDMAREKMDSEALDALRSVYILARYDGSADEADLKQAQSALKRLKEG